MTDRYYPKGCVPEVGNNAENKLESTYNEMNMCKTQPRSKYPPGYGGHEHGAAKKFGYSIPAPDALPKEPIDPEEPLVNFRSGKYVTYEPLPNRQLVIENAPPPAPKAVLNYRGVEAQAKSLTQENERMATFTPQTSAYLSSIGGQHGSTIDKEVPYTPAFFGIGTGFNSAKSSNTGFNTMNASIEGSSTTKDAFLPPKARFTPQGLNCLEYTLKKTGA
ncbi:unnamed protein product [Amoebophrya sp. A25]|nr:unnamed protein product [Amoebophrya sp. A25]|eukprot:GSA25T00003089001.1